MRLIQLHVIVLGGWAGSTRELLQVFSVCSNVQFHVRHVYVVLCITSYKTLNTNP